MKPQRLIAAFALATAHFFAFHANLAADPDVQDGSRFDQELNERDFEALRRYLNRKREIDLETKDTNLSISGDVRFEWRHLNEYWRGNYLRGHNAINPRNHLPISRNDFDCEFNLKFDYTMDRSWAVAHLQYDNSAGVDSEDQSCANDPHGWFGSGKCDEICLRKAYMGYNFWMDPCSRFDIELGRRGNLYHVFDSRVQFLSRFDGILLKWSGNYGFAKEVYAKVGGLVVDERVNHFAYVTEVGILNIKESGIDLKYSFIDWCGQVGSRCIKGVDNCNHYRSEGLNKPKAFDFAVSQWTVYYHFKDCLFNRPAKLFGAFLMNHKWKDFEVLKDVTVINPETGNPVVETRKRKYQSNLAWYAGIAIGEVTKEGDWALEIQYQYVQALAVPGQDASGICNGNVFDYTLTQDGRFYIDNTNYKGWKVEGLYALTDNITIDTIVEHSVPVNKAIGGNHVYSKVEVEAIYAF